MPALVEPAAGEPLEVINALGDLERTTEVPGWIQFEVPGIPCALAPFSIDEDGVFPAFCDRGTGLQTYPGGRLLQTPPPHHGRLTLDFSLRAQRLMPRVRKRTATPSGRQMQGSETGKAGGAQVGRLREGSESTAYWGCFGAAVGDGLPRGPVASAHPRRTAAARSERCRAGSRPSAKRMIRRPRWTSARRSPSA